MSCKCTEFLLISNLLEVAVYSTTTNKRERIAQNIVEYNHMY